MKLSQQFESESLALPENILWTQEVQSFFFKILSESPEIDESRISYQDLIFNYKLSDEEIDFYTNRYVPIGDVIVSNPSSIVHKYFEDVNFELNVREKDIFDYILEIPNNKLMVIGKVGWGKSTVLKYCFFYLTQKNEKLKNIIHPIFISLHTELRNSSQKANNLNVDDIFYSSILLPRLKKYTDSIVDISNDGFWVYISSLPEFADYNRTYNNIYKTYDKIELQNKKINELRNEIQLTHKELYLFALNYSKVYLSKRPIIIIDDADKVSIDLSSLILEKIRRISQKYSVKIIFAVRPSTYNALFKKNKHLKRIINPAKSVFGIPNLKPYLASRKELLLDYREQNKGIEITLFGEKYTKFDAISFLINMVDLLLKNENIQFVYSVSNGDIRKLTSILKIYFNSDFINHNDLFLRFMKNEFSSSKLPDWLLHIPIITNNHKLYLSDDDFSSADEFILNVFLSSVNNKCHPMFMLYVLKYMEKVEVSTFDMLKREVKRLFSAKKTNLTFDNLFNKTIHKLINYGLLNSEDVFHIDDIEDLKLINGLSIDSSGRFYLNNLIYIFEYLVYVKDDFHFKSSYGDDISDVILSKGIVKRYADVNRFIKYLYIEENAFISKLGKKLFFEYKINFAPNNDVLFFTEALFVKHIEFGQKNLKHNVNIHSVKTNLEMVKDSTKIYLEKYKRH